jgi:hypothetical protein
MRECTPMQVKMAPLIITERRIIIYLCSFMGGIIGLFCLGDGVFGHQTDADQRRCHMSDAEDVGFVCLGVSARAENRRDRAFHICIILWCRRRADNLSTAIRIFDRYGGAAPWPAC